MSEYWESKFKNEGTLWKFEPADSAIIALKIFKSAGIKKILIPGIGYGRNAKLFYDEGFRITGIEISQSAIRLAKENGMDFTIHHGSVNSMPFDNEQYDGIFCYALIHLLNNKERQIFLKSCFNQLKPCGLMIFTVVSKQYEMYGKGKLLSRDRFEITKGINVYFYDPDSVKKEFAGFGLMQSNELDEPVKFMTGENPIKCIFVLCKKD